MIKLGFIVDSHDDATYGKSRPAIATNYQTKRAPLFI